MLSWTLSFSIPSSPKLSRKEQEKWDKEIYRAIKPLVDSCTSLGDCKIDLDSPKLPELIACLEEFHRKKVAWINCPEFTQRLTDDAETRIEWFLLEPVNEGEYFTGTGEELPTCNADRFKPGVQVAGYLTNLALSERFKRLVLEQKLTGLDFLWMKDLSKYRAPQWYMPIAHEPLGRGLDHPWFDASKMSGQGMESVDPRSRCGQSIVTSLGGYKLKPDAAFGEPVKDKLLKLAKSMSGRRMVIVTRPIFLREYLPNTDFAFTLGDEQNGDFISKLRGLAVNRKTRDLLIANNLAAEDECTGVVVLDEPYEGAEVLDTLYGKPEPLFLPEQLDMLRAKEARAWAEFITNPKTVRSPSLPRALTLLKQRKRNRPKDFAPPAKQKDVAKASESLGLTIPEAWQKVLQVSNGCKIRKCVLASGHSCTIVEVDKLPKEHRAEAKYYQEIGARLDDALLLVMQTELGDSIWLDTAKQKPDGDCRVVMMSHETGTEEREWPSVAAFLEELLTEED